jgi:hypothetical protein
MGPVTVFVDPGKYQYYNCEQLAGQRTHWTNRELELKLLMDKAEQGTGGTVVNVIAYQTDYVTAREELKVIETTARAKNCDAPRRPWACSDPAMAREAAMAAFAKSWRSKVGR